MSDFQCPFPLSRYPLITLAHGGGGKLTAQLIDEAFRPLFANPLLDDQHDGACVPITGERLAFTTDSYVVKPLEFPGGDIGKLAVFGTVNDLAMCGARARYLSCGFIIEEGLPTETLLRIAHSMRLAALEADVQLVTGDTKVVEKGSGDGLYINTSGIGTYHHERSIGPKHIQKGDAILLSGDIGRHGIAVMSQREGLMFESAIQSDCASLKAPVEALFREGIAVHCLRDLTRGGLATALVELAETSGLAFAVDEKNIAVSDAVAGACEILGLDPLYVANEGRFISFVAAEDAERALAVLHKQEPTRNALVLGRVLEERSQYGHVRLHLRFGSERMLDRLTGEQLPRIC